MEWVQENKLFLTCWPHGRLRHVVTLGQNKSIKGGIYIRYLDTGGTDTTTPEFLLDYPPEPPTDNR